MHPNSLHHFTPRLVLSTVFLWTVSRIALFLIGGFLVAPLASVLLIAALVFVLALERRRANEDVLAQNLGVAPRALHAVVGITALILEIAVFAVHHALTRGATP